MIKKSIIFGLILMMNQIVFAQRVVGYFPYYRSTTQANAVQYSKLTDVIYAFAQLNNDGSLTIMGQSVFDAVKAKAASNNVKLWIAIGGWGLSYNFSGVAADATKRATLANACLSLCQTHNLAGIDIDWEFPAAGEKANYTAMLKDIKTKLGSTYKLSAALGGEQAHTVGVEAACFQYLDYFNIMSYDAPIGTYGNHTAVQFLKDAFQMYKTLGCPVSKIVGGSGFYSRCAAEATFADISASNPSAYYNDADGINNGYCYDSKPTLEAKVDYVMQNGGNGLMIWELSQDRNDQYSLLNAVFDKMKIYQGPGCSAPNLGSDKTLCGVSGGLTLNSGLTSQSYRTFTWTKGGVTTGGNTATLTGVTTAGTYVVKVDSAGKCSKTDTIIVSATLPTVNLGNAITLCSKSTETLDAGVSGTGITYSWTKDNAAIANANAKTLLVSTAGTYKVTVSASGCSNQTGSITVSSNLVNAPSVTICKAGVANLKVTDAGTAYEWYNASTNGTLLASGATYSPTVNSNTSYFVGRANTLTTTTLGKTSLSGWASTATFYANKFSLTASSTLSQVSFQTSAAGDVTLNILASDGSTVVSTKTVTVTSGINTATLDIALAAGTYYIAASSTPAGQLYFDGSAASTDFVSNGITVFKNAYTSWSSPIYSGVDNGYGFFYNFKFTSGSGLSCARTQVDVKIDAVNCLPTGIDNNDIDGSLTVYPNPTEGDITIQIPSTLQGNNVNVTLVNAIGNVVNQLELTNVAEIENINLSNLPTGLYLLKLNSKIGNYTSKVFVK